MTDVGVPVIVARHPMQFPRGRALEILWMLAAIALAAALGLTDSRTGLTVAIGAATFAATLVRPSVGLAGLVASVPLQNAWPASLGSLSLTWTRLLLVCFLLGWMFRLLTGRSQFRTTPVIWSMIAYCLALTVSVINAVELPAAAAEIYRWGVATVVLIAGSSVIRARNDRAVILISLVAGVVFSFGVALYQVVTDTGPATFNQRGVIRAYGLFGEPNPFAAYLAMATLALLAYTLLAVNRGNIREPMTLVTAFGAAIGCTSLVLTQSRGGAIGFAAGLAVLFWLIFPRSGRFLTIAGITVVGLSLLMPIAAPVRSALGIETLFRHGPVQVTTENFAAQERLAHWGAALRMWQSQPIVGVGAGNVVANFREFTPEWRFRIPRGHAHNVYLQAAAQAGAIGLICYLAVLTTAWRRCRRQLAQAMTLDRRAACCGALAVTAAVTVHGVFEYVHVLSLGIIVSAIWASVEFDAGPKPAAVALHGDD